MSATTTATAAAPTTTMSTTSVKLPSIHELTGKSTREFNNKHLQGNALASPRSFANVNGQPPVLPSLRLNTDFNEPVALKIPPIKPMTPSSVALNNSNSSTPTAPVQSNNSFTKTVSLGSPAINYQEKQQILLSKHEPAVAQAPIVSATTAPQSVSATSTVSSPTYHFQPSHQPQLSQQLQSAPVPPSFQSPIEYNVAHGSPQYHQPLRSFSAPVPQYLPPHVSYYSKPHFAVQHPNNHGLQMGHPYTITEVVPKTTNKCHRCGTTETPEWRRGPKGVRTLCNACGLFHAKLVKRKGAAVAAEEVLNNRVTKGKNGRRISFRKLVGKMSTMHHHRSESVHELQGLQQHLQHYPAQFAVLHHPHSNSATSPLQQAPLHANNSQAYQIHHQQIQQPPSNANYIPQGYMPLPPPAVPVNPTMHFQSQARAMPLVHQ